MNDLNRKLYRSFKQRIENHKFVLALPFEADISTKTRKESKRIHTKYITRLSRAVRYLNHRLGR